MTIEQAVNHYGSQAALAKALSISRTAVWLWRQDKEIPELRQYQIELLTNGKLKAARKK